MAKAFTDEYFSAPASGAAIFLVLLGIVLARISASCGDWWKGYLQGLSTTLVGLSFGVLLLQYLLDFQHERSREQLRRFSELALVRSLKKTITSIDAWIPSASAVELAPAHIPQLEWARTHVDDLREAANILASEVTHQEDRQKLEDFGNSAGELADALAVLVFSIRTNATKRAADNLKTVLDLSITLKYSAGRVISRFGEELGAAAVA